MTKKVILSSCYFKYYAWAYSNGRPVSSLCMYHPISLFCSHAVEVLAGNHDCLVAIFTFCIFVHIEVSSIISKWLSFRLNVSALHLKIPSFMGPSVRIHLGMIVTCINVYVYWNE